MQRTCAMNDSGRFYGPKGWWHWKLWGGTRPSLCSQGILGIGEGKWQVDNLEVWLLLLSFEDLGQGKLTGSGVQSIGPRSMGWENFQIYGQREAVPQGGGGRDGGRKEGHHHSHSLCVKHSSETL